MRDFSLQFFLKVGDLLLTIPVNPEELEIAKEIGYDSYSNLDKQEILKLQEDKLMAVEIQSVLEKIVSSASVTDTPWTPVQYLNTFNGWKKNRTIVRVTSSDGQIDFEGYIVSVITNYQGGTDDYNYTLKIVQERSVQLITNIDNNYSKIDIEYAVIRYTPQTNPTTPTETNTGTSNPSNSSNNQTVIYTVKRGDTLSSIARMYYGNSSKWTDIFNANKDVIKNANLIYSGQKLRIPNSDGTVKSSTSSSRTKSTTNKTSTPSSKNPTKNDSPVTPTKTGNENKPFYNVVLGVEFWGKPRYAECDNRWTTEFYFDSGTYKKFDRRVSETIPVAVGKISSYQYVTSEPILNRDGTKYVKTESAW